MNLKIVVMGSAGVGKSSITLQFIQNSFPEKYDPTIEDSYHKIITNPPCELEVLDTAGSEQFASMRDLYIKNGDGFILVFSLTDKKTLQELNEVFERIKEKNKKIMLVGNKKDLIIGNNEPIDEMAEAMSRKWQCPFLSISAKNQSQVEEAFLALIRQLQNLPFKQVESKRKKQKKPKKEHCLIM